MLTGVHLPLPPACSLLLPAWAQLKSTASHLFILPLFSLHPHPPPPLDEMTLTGSSRAAGQAAGGRPKAEGRKICIFHSSSFFFQVWFLPLFCCLPLGILHFSPLSNMASSSKNFRQDLNNNKYTTQKNREHLLSLFSMEGKTDSLENFGDVFYFALQLWHPHQPSQTEQTTWLAIPDAFPPDPSLSLTLLAPHPHRLGGAGSGES